MSQPVTIYDVAKLAGVSISTVSRVLNNPHMVSEDKRRKVMEVIDRLGFVPKAAAIAHARKEIGRIGVLSPYFTRPSFSQRMRGIAKTISDTNYELAIYPISSKERLTGLLGKLATTRQVDGIILISILIDDESTQRLVDSGLPVVFIETPHAAFSSIEIDNFYGGRLAAQHLIDRGFTNFAFVDHGELPDYTLRCGEQRLAGFISNLNETGLEIKQDQIVLPKLFDFDDAYTQISLMLKRSKPPISIFIADDYFAMIILRIVRELHLHIPNDVAIVGFDDIDVAEHIGLTTINQSLDESGELAAELLLNRIAKNTTTVQNIKLQLKLIERETT